VRIRHYYHCYAAGAWSGPVRDHFTALGRAGLDDTVTTVGLIGPEADRRMARERITELCAKWALPQPSHWEEAGDGWEQVTLMKARADLLESSDEYAVLYMHTKGAANDLDSSASWRRSMTRALTVNWEDCVSYLEHGYDVVGCHHVRSPEWPEQVPFFAGNFWWARASYLRTLEAPLNETRWQAETWVNLGSPRVYDMLPGWPDYG
jgi:hypothetical protein